MVCAQRLFSQPGLANMGAEFQLQTGLLWSPWRGPVALEPASVVLSTLLLLFTPRGLLWDHRYFCQLFCLNLLAVKGLYTATCPSSNWTPSNAVRPFQVGMDDLAGIL